jgi:hypothetical protein
VVSAGLDVILFEVTFFNTNNTLAAYFLLTAKGFNVDPKQAGSLNYI